MHPNDDKAARLHGERQPGKSVFLPSPAACARQLDVNALGYQPMLQISGQQMQAFQAAQLRRYVDNLVDHLHREFEPILSKHRLSDARLRQIVLQGIERAKLYRIENEYDITRFIEFVFEYGAEFESLPWVSPALEASHLSGAEKMDELDAICTFTLRP